MFAAMVKQVSSVSRFANGRKLLSRGLATTRSRVAAIPVVDYKLVDTASHFPSSSLAINSKVIRAQSASTSVKMGGSKVSKKERDAQVWQAIEEGLHTGRMNGDIIVFTDGGAKTNPGPAGMGITIEIPLVKYSAPEAKPDPSLPVSSTFVAPKPVIHALRLDVAMSVGTATNNYCEINAIKHALLILSNIDELIESDQPVPLQGRHVRLHSDSLLCIKLLTGEWKPKDMKESVAEIRKTILDYQDKHGCNIEFIWVKGHGASSENERADTLATIGQMASLNAKIATTLEQPLMCEEGSGVHAITYVMQQNNRLKPLVIK